MDEIGGDYLIFSVSKYSFEFSFGGFFDSLADLSIGGAFFDSASEIND